MSQDEPVHRRQACDGLSGQTDVVRDPSNGEVVAEITLAGPDDVDRAVAGRPERVPRVVASDPGRAIGGADHVRRAAGGPGRGDRRSWRAARGQADPAGPGVRRARHDRQRRVLRRRRPQPGGQGDRGVLRRPHVLDPAGAGRRGRLDLAVELPAADGRLEDPAGDRGRQHHRAQAVGAHAADHACCSPRSRTEAGLPAGRGERADRHRRRLRRGAAAAPARSTWSRSPGRPGSAARSWRPRRPPPNGCTWSSAARRRSWSSTTPTWRRPSTEPWPAA